MGDIVDTNGIRKQDAPVLEPASRSICAAGKGLAALSTLTFAYAGLQIEFPPPDPPHAVPLL
eukprot:CAMPEP_0168380096 /NCGR_PEP_ID=MMETSP0228-20121227/12183_1 /TAXON_ID=133427 /ORGANISM="Protoceratium reticulatum, Strain CCCM 535 (=CCMP 1889)" /LENGTH=61 /DNA_ID=CAMNT_0008393149 /DNA_START=690 /DNA_END=871 /DNA_ORIENTATION=+